LSFAQTFEVLVVSLYLEVVIVICTESESPRRTHVTTAVTTTMKQQGAAKIEVWS
jgi:hypothetical protein